jgi:hypothetical protein
MFLICFFPSQALSQSKKFPLHKDGRSNRQQEDQQEDGQLFLERVARLCHADPHVARGDQEPNDREDPRCVGHRGGTCASKKLCDGQADCPEYEAAENDDQCPHDSPFSLLYLGNGDVDRDITVTNRTNPSGHSLFVRTPILIS